MMTILSTREWATIIWVVLFFQLYAEYINENEDRSCLWLK